MIPRLTLARFPARREETGETPHPVAGISQVGITVMARSHGAVAQSDSTEQKASLL